MSHYVVSVKLTMKILMAFSENMNFNYAKKMLVHAGDLFEWFYLVRSLTSAEFLYLKPHKLVYSTLGTRSKRDFISIRLIYLMVYPTLLPNVSCTLDFTWFWKLHIHLTIFCKVLCRLRRNVFSLLLDYLRVCFHHDKVFSFKEK